MSEGFSAKQWLEATPEAFDLVPEYEAEVRPLMDQVLAVCEKYGMPFHAVFATRQGADNGSSSASFGYTVSPERLTVEVIAAHHGSDLDVRAVIGAIACDQERTDRLASTKH